MKLLDTTFLIHYWGGVDDVASYLESQDDCEFVTTPLNIKEVAVGRELQGKLDRYEIRSTFGWVRILPFETEHAFVAGELEADLRRDGSINQDRINSLAADLLIAAVATTADATIVTENASDFELFEGLSVETYL